MRCDLLVYLLLSLHAVSGRGAERGRPVGWRGAPTACADVSAPHDGLRRVCFCAPGKEAVERAVHPGRGGKRFDFSSSSSLWVPRVSPPWRAAAGVSTEGGRCCGTPGAGGTGGRVAGGSPWAPSSPRFRLRDRYLRAGHRWDGEERRGRQERVSSPPPRGAEGRPCRSLHNWAGVRGGVCACGTARRAPAGPGRQREARSRYRRLPVSHGRARGFK